ncbi:hypothetical protein GG344DRAFT_68598 [Lentinula edodes]|nr:hypothetical protein GG344DRAFT_68598 [Lentinula edodes]
MNIYLSSSEVVRQKQDICLERLLVNNYRYLVQHMNDRQRLTIYGLQSLFNEVASVNLYIIDISDLRVTSASDNDSRFVPPKRIYLPISGELTYNQFLQAGYREMHIDNQITWAELGKGVDICVFRVPLFCPMYVPQRGSGMGGVCVRRSGAICLDFRKELNEDVHWTLQTSTQRRLIYLPCASDMSITWSYELEDKGLGLASPNSLLASGRLVYGTEESITYFQLLIGSRFIEFIRPVSYSVEVKKKWTAELFCESVVVCRHWGKLVLTVSQLNALDSILNQTIHPSERMVAQLSKSTGLTALEVKNQRRRLRRNQLKDRALREDDISSRFCSQLSCSGSGQDFKCNNGTYNIIGVRIDIEVANV